MSSYQPLKTLLSLKQAAEEAAAAILAAQTARCAAAEGVAADLEGAVEWARADLRARRQAAAPTGLGAETAALAGERERFWARLSDEIGARVARAQAHRDGALVQARAAAATALTAHRVAREARVVVARLLERGEAAQRQVDARRDEARLDEQSQAIHALGGRK